MRAFIVGNGPSLARTRLDLLQDEVTFGTGRIHLSGWYPKFYVLAEGVNTVHENRIRHDLRDIALNVERCYLQAGLSGLAFVPHPNCEIEYFTTCQHANTGAPETWHLPQLCSYGSSVHVAMQIATNLGYAPLYLVGCDLTGGHFTDEYGESAIQTRLWEHAHEIAARSNPNIYNATVGGNLEAYPKVKLGEVLCQKNSILTA